MDFMSPTWCDLQWTPWIPFSNPKTFKHLPPQPGLYRIRATGKNELFYIGETGRDLRERLGALRCNTLKAVMPYNAPHTAAPSLWAWRDAEGLDFDCSVAPIVLGDEKEEARKLREGLEAYLLWQYRLAFGMSTRCNHGRFHPRYKKSTDGEKKFRGHHLPDEIPDNLAGGPSIPPLQLISHPFDNDWIGLQWTGFEILQSSTIKQIPKIPGVYRIVYLETRELLYIGESDDLRSRLTSHAKKTWGESPPLFSFVLFPQGTPAYQRHEIENDLIGSFYSLTKRVPKFQLINHR